MEDNDVLVKYIRFVLFSKNIRFVLIAKLLWFFIRVCNHTTNMELLIYNSYARSWWKH
jgi:hypothetical protein